MQSSCWSHNTYRGISMSTQWNCFTCSHFLFIYVTSINFSFSRENFKSFLGHLKKYILNNVYEQVTESSPHSVQDFWWARTLQTASLMCAVFSQISLWGCSTGELWFSRWPDHLQQPHHYDPIFLSSLLRMPLIFLSSARNTTPHFPHHLQANEFVALLGSCQDLNFRRNKNS